jgi:hypothetical protein
LYPIKLFKVFHVTIKSRDKVFIGLIREKFPVRLASCHSPWTTAFDTTGTWTSPFENRNMSFHRILVSGYLAMDGIQNLFVAATNGLD